MSECFKGCGFGLEGPVEFVDSLLTLLQRDFLFNDLLFPSPKNILQVHVV